MLQDCVTGWNIDLRVLENGEPFSIYDIRLTVLAEGHRAAANGWDRQDRWDRRREAIDRSFWRWRITKRFSKVFD
jgi:hypothetical protein